MLATSPTCFDARHPFDPWTALNDELDQWRAAGRTATLWWRDDDAVQPSAALDRLLGLARRHCVPIALAVIPNGADRALAARIAAGDEASVVQHGWAHANHAGVGEKKMELGDHRPVDVILHELRRGFDHLVDLFGDRFHHVLVPPWNRIGTAVRPGLAAAGYRGLSLFGAREATVRDGVVLANTHADPISWRGGRGFVGAAKTLDALTGHLAARRTFQVDANEPTGLLTHHLIHDAPLWNFLDQCLEMLAAHPAVHLLPALDVFADPGP